MALPKVRFPKDTVISAMDGATAYRGYAAAMIDNSGEVDDVVIMARDIATLRLAMDRYSPGCAIDENHIHEVVIVQRKHATLDDEL